MSCCHTKVAEVSVATKVDACERTAVECLVGRLIILDEELDKRNQSVAWNQDIIRGDIIQRSHIHCRRARSSLDKSPVVTPPGFGQPHLTAMSHPP